MNIFKILSTGDGKVYEPSVSAFLAYLLDPNENHGLNDSFLKIFLKENNISNKNIDLFASVETEVPFSLPEEKENENAKKRDIDIVIELLDNDGKIEQIIFVENKIKNSAYNKSQIIDQGKIIENYMTYFSNGDVETQKKKNEKIFVNSFIKNHILLLPDTKMTEDVRKDFGTLVQCITWEHVYNQLVTILKSEHDASIDPVFEYTKHTIKAFAQFIKSGFKSRLIEKKELSERN